MVKPSVMQKAIINNFTQYCKHFGINCTMIEDGNNVEVNGDYSIYINILQGQVNITIFNKNKPDLQRHGFKLINIVFRLAIAEEAQYTVVFSQMTNGFYNYMINRQGAVSIDNDAVQMMKLLV